MPWRGCWGEGGGEIGATVVGERASGGGWNPSRVEKEERGEVGARGLCCARGCGCEGVAKVGGGDLVRCVRKMYVEGIERSGGGFFFLRA